MVVLVIVGTLTTISLSMFGKTASRARRTGVDQFTAAVEQARTSAITRRKPVVLAIAPPVTGSNDQKCRYGLFEIDELPDEGSDLEAVQVQRWNLMPDGVIFLDGKVDGLRNVIDEDEIRITWKDGENEARIRALVFSPRGGLMWPAGSDPVALTIGTGTYIDGQPRSNSAGGHNSLRIGRVVARPWRLD